MSDIDLFAENELTPIESEERAFHEGVVDDVKGGIEKLASIGDASLKVLRDKRLYRTTHKTFEDYCQERFGFSRQRASQKIGFLALLDNLSTRVDKAPATEGQARPLTALPTPDLQAQAWEQAQADSGKEQPSNREVAEAVAKVQAIEAELEAEKRRNLEWRDQWKEKRDLAERALGDLAATTDEKGRLQLHVAALERRIDLFDSELKPEPVKVVERVEVIPTDYEAIKAKAAQLETELATKDAELAQNKAEQNRIIQSAINSKMSGYQGKVDTCQSEVNKLESNKKALQEEIDRLKTYLDSLNDETIRIGVHRDIIEENRLRMINIAAFLDDMAPMHDEDTIHRWLALAGMHTVAAEKIYEIFESTRPVLTIIQGGGA